MGSSAAAYVNTAACCCHSDELEAEPMVVPSVFAPGMESDPYEAPEPETLPDPSKTGSGLQGLALAQPLAPTPSLEWPGFEKGRRPSYSSSSPGFLVRLERTPEAKALGMRVDFNDGRKLQIVRIAGGLVGLHNESASAGNHVSVGDFIVDVNGITGDAGAMMTALKETSALCLKVVPAMTFSVLVEGGQLGVTFIHDPESTSLLVARVDGGAIGKYNSTAPDEKQVRAFDRICSVNGVVGTADSLLTALRDSGRLALRITRPRA